MWLEFSLLIHFFFFLKNSVCLVGLEPDDRTPFWQVNAFGKSTSRNGIKLELCLKDALLLPAANKRAGLHALGLFAAPSTRAAAGPGRVHRLF